MEKKIFEPIEQNFGGSTEELREFINAFLVRHAPRTNQPEGFSEYLVVTPALEPESFFVERVFAKTVKDAEGMRLGFDKGRTRQEGTIRIRPTEIPIPSTSMVDPHCAAFTCRPLTEDCKKLALSIAEDIKRKGYDLPGGHNAVLPKSGRPHKKDDEWAWAQVNIFGHSKAEIYPRWLARIEDDRERKIEEPDKHFNRITKREWG